MNVTLENRAAACKMPRPVLIDGKACLDTESVYDAYASIVEQMRLAHSSKTLANQVDDLACKCIRLEGLADEMLATIKLNVDRGYIVATNDQGKLNLDNIVASWSRQLAELR